MYEPLIENVKVASYDLNPRGKARFTSMANYFQEMAYQHASQLGFGYNDLKEKGTMWILSRMRIRMDRYPAWDDVIQIATWPSGINKLFAIRDFRVTDSTGKEMGVASTAWLMLNIDTRRPLRPSSSLEGLLTRNSPVFDNPLGKIELPDAMEKLANRKVVYSDLDIVSHVNNVKYMEWCIDAEDSEVVTGKEIRDFEINYLNEAVLEDEIEIFRTSIGQDDSIFSARRVNDSQEIIRVRMAWE